MPGILPWFTGYHITTDIPLSYISVTCLAIGLVSLSLVVLSPPYSQPCICNLTYLYLLIIGLYCFDLSAHFLIYRHSLFLFIPVLFIVFSSLFNFPNIPLISQLFQLESLRFQSITPRRWFVLVGHQVYDLCPVGGIGIMHIYRSLVMGMHELNIKKHK